MVFETTTIRTFERSHVLLTWQEKTSRMRVGHVYVACDDKQMIYLCGSLWLNTPSFEKLIFGDSKKESFAAINKRKSTGK